MNIRLAKELWELGPGFGITAACIALPYLIWGAKADQAGFFALAIGCAVMGASVFGHELQHRTLGLLLSQPIRRAELWREKMLALGLGILGCVGLLLMSLARVHLFRLGAGDVWALAILICLCGWGGAP